MCEMVVDVVLTRQYSRARAGITVRPRSLLSCVATIRSEIPDEAGSLCADVAGPGHARRLCRNRCAQGRTELLPQSGAARSGTRRGRGRVDDLRISRQQRVMAKRDKLDHGAGKPFVQRLKGSGYDAKTAAENISAGYHTFAEAFSGWRDSNPHRANMLLAGATRMGIAAVYTPASKYKIYWSLILAEPEDK